ncbi:MAG: hypothetical protein GF330_10590 [Candidatus Eisenbacteria bacterium]|nr:hypothetical protein [Candidatus Eisenbacteria bacterium]
MPSHPRDPILVWTRELSTAEEFRRALADSGFVTRWAAALHEAIAAVSDDFPRAVVCTLDDEIPSLMDLETLLTYLSMGDESLSLPPIPIWSLSRWPERHAPAIARLGLPVRLLPSAVGSGVLARDVARALGAEAAPDRAPARDATTIDVLLVAPNDAQASRFAGYLRSRGLRARSLADPGEALELLARQSVGAVVTELFATRRALLPFLEQIARVAPTSPVIVITADARWLAARPGRDLLPNVVCTLPKPVKATALEACLRRLLRIPAPAPRVGVAAVAY